MAKKVEYTVAVDVDIEKLGIKVAEMLGQGWEPCGGLCVIPAGLAQAVLRDPDRVEAKRVRKTSLDDTAEQTAAS